MLSVLVSLSLSQRTLCYTYSYGKLYGIIKYSIISTFVRYSLVFRTNSLRTPSNYFIINLAISDGAFSLINGFPLMSVASFRRKWMWGQVGMWCCISIEFKYTEATQWQWHQTDRSSDLCSITEPLSLRTISSNIIYQAKMTSQQRPTTLSPVSGLGLVDKILLEYRK